MTTKQLLKGCNVFEALTDADLEQIAGLSQFREYEAGASIFHEKSIADYLFVLQEGKVALQMQLALAQPQMSKRVTVEIVNKNEVVGWSALVEPHRYKLTAVCLEPTRTLAIDGAGLRDMLQADQWAGYKVLSRLIKVVASRLDETRHVLASERLVSTSG